LANGPNTFSNLKYSKGSKCKKFGWKVDDVAETTLAGVKRQLLLLAHIIVRKSCNLPVFLA
jgi:hypothetical protein